MFQGLFQALSSRLPDRCMAIFRPPDRSPPANYDGRPNADLLAEYQKLIVGYQHHVEFLPCQIEHQQQQLDTYQALLQTLSAQQQTPKYDLRGAQFAGGFAEQVKGNQVGNQQVTPIYNS